MMVCIVSLKALEGILLRGENVEDRAETRDLEYRADEINVQVVAMLAKQMQQV